MSLVICSNTAEDDLDNTTINNINKPFSFRNALSSTYKIPPNAQVALQSIKYSLDSSLVLSTDSRTMYQYYGEDLNVNNAEDNPSTITRNSTAVPIKTPLVDTTSADTYPTDTKKQFNLTSLKKAFGDQLGKYMYHPNQRYKAFVDLDTNTDGTFTGFKLNYDYYDSATSNIPDDDYAEDLLNDAVNEGIYEQSWTYEAGVFSSSNPNDEGTPQAAILTQYPISLHNGVLTVNFNNANASGKEWAVGLSRYIQTQDDITGRYTLNYFSRPLSGDQMPSKYIGFYDYLVCRKGNTLKVYHTPFDSSISSEKLISREMIYGNNEIAEDYDLDTNASSFHKVKFTCIGQQIKIEMLESDDTAHTLYEYDSTYDNVNQLKPICQSNWNMYPILYLEDPELDASNSLTVETFTGVTTFASNSWEVSRNDASWFNAVYASNNLQVARELELRIWNDNNEDLRQNYLVYADILSGTNQVIDLENVIITKPSNLYVPTNDANTTAFLGFVGDSESSNFSYATGSDPHTRRIFTSVSQPVLINNKSFFVKLNNLTQSSTNAYQGNRSTIIAHVPQFDGQVTTGRIYYEPNTPVYLDLNNSNELNISSFDLSLVHVTEQFAMNVSGQTIIVLHIRQKPN